MFTSKRHLVDNYLETFNIKEKGNKIYKEDKYYNIVREKFESDISKHYFDTDMLIKLLDEHREGKFDNSRKIWTVFSFLIWYDVYFNDKWSL